MLEERECEECGKAIGPDDGYVEIDIATDVAEEPVRAVRLHSNGDCIEKFHLKHPPCAKKEKKKQ